MARSAMLLPSVDTKEKRSNFRKTSLPLH
jgi:hypothetical protein